MRNYVEDWTLGMVQRNKDKVKVIHKRAVTEISRLRNSISTLKQKRTALEQLIKTEESKLGKLLEN